jgi:recombination DNA repair RAD52 pathway protein
MNRELLEKPFESNQIKQREGMFGKTLDYIEGHAVIQRLNEVFEAEWSFSILKHEVLKETDEVLVLGQLSAGSVDKNQFGSSKITRAKNSGEPISLADDHKAAATDCLKKCATMLGVGLHLYNGDKPHNGKTVNRVSGYGLPTKKADNLPGNGDRKNGNENGGGNGNGGNGNGNGRLSAKQFKFILRLNDEAGRSREDLDSQSLEMFGVVAQHLNKKDASALIEHLISK